MGLLRTLPKWLQIKPPSRKNIYFSLTLAMVQVPEPLQERVPDDWQVFLPTGSSYGGGWGQLQSRPQQCCHCNWRMLRGNWSSIRGAAPVGLGAFGGHDARLQRLAGWLASSLAYSLWSPGQEEGG